MARLAPLADAIADVVRDGSTVALEGFTHLIPFAAGHEIVRQRLRELELIRMTPDILYDQLIGMGVARRLVFSYAGNPGVGSLHRIRDAVESDWPMPLELVEHTHAEMANRYVAGAGGMPCGLMRGHGATDLGDRPFVTTIECPFTKKNLVAVAPLNPDVAVIHAQEADGRGNVQLWGIPGVQKEAILCARKSIVTVERLVRHLSPQPGNVVIPGWVIDYICEVRGGAHPSYAMGLTERDNEFYRLWDAISRDRTRFLEWMRSNVLEAQ